MPASGIETYPGEVQHQEDGYEGAESVDELSHAEDPDGAGQAPDRHHESGPGRTHGPKVAE